MYKLCSNFSFVDGSSKFQQTSHLDQNCSQLHKRKQEEQCAFTQLKDNNTLVNGVQQRKHKKARLYVNQEAVVNDHVFQKMLQGQNSADVERDQLHAFSQQNPIQNQDKQATFNTDPQLGVDREQKLQWMRHLVPQQEMVHQTTAMHQPGVCSHRLMQYLYYTRKRPNVSCLIN